MKASVSIPFGLIGVIFVVLKLVNVIDWSWWIVTAPFWGPIAFAVLIYASIIFLVIIGALMNK